MKKIHTLTGYATILMLAGATTFTTLAQAAADEEVSGILLHAIEDDFENGKERHHLSIHDPKTKKSKKLVFKDGKIPEKLMHAPSGTKIKVKGKKTEDDLIVAYDGGGTFDYWLDSSTGIWKATPMTGTKTILAVKIDFNDNVGACFDEASIFRNVFDPNYINSTKNFYKTNSQNLMDISGKVVKVKLNLNVSSTTVCKEPDFNKWADMADQILNNAGHNVSSYDHRMYFIPPNLTACGFAGYGYIGGGQNWTKSYARSWIKWCNQKTIAHELGHNLGLTHAAAGEGTASWDPYGDLSDSMGRQITNEEFNAAHKYQLGWIPSAKIQDITANGTYKVAPLNADSASAAYPQIFRVYKSAKEYYYLSYRERTTESAFDKALPLTYASRLNITKWTEEYNMYTHFITALGAGGSAVLPSTTASVKANAVNASYIEFTVSGLSTSTPTTIDTTVPSVTLSGPANGATFAAGASVTASATASDNVAVSKVAFYVGGVLKSTDSTSPYNYSFSMPTSSSLSVYAIAYDAAGNLKQSATSFIKNPTTTADTTFPSVTLSGPANGATFAAGASVTASATASDNVAVTKVLFYVGGVLKSTDTVAPYNYSFSMPTNSSLSVYAIAYDAAGNLKKSAISYIKNPTTTTADTTVPSVTLSSPLNGATYAAGASVMASATASDNVAVTKVLFYVGGVLKSTDTVAPYNYSFSMPTSSSLSVYAIAYDAAGNLKKSAISYIKNPTTTTTTTADTIRPSVYLNTPAVGTKIAAGSTFTITATASDNKAVTKVSFYFNGKYCTDTTAPYSCSFLMTTGSNLMLRATAYDAANNYKYSNLVYVSN